MQYSQAHSTSVCDFFRTLLQTMGGLKRCQVNQLQDIGPEVLYFSKVELASLNEDKLRTSSDSLENADLPSAGTIAVPPPLDVDGRPTTVTIRHLLPQVSTGEDVSYPLNPVRLEFARISSS